MATKFKWPTKQLGDLAEFRNGVNYNKSSFGVGVRVVGVSDFQDYTRPRYAKLEQINPEGILTERNILRDGDIVFVRSNGNRELVGRSLFIERPPEEVTHSAFTIRLRFTAGNVFPKFFAYCFRTPVIRQAMTAHSGGTNISNLNQDILTALEVPFPPLLTQRKISAILSAYDDLIENNLRRIKILEEMAQTIYREWFVKFRYPGHHHARFTDSPLGRIPEGWEVKTLGSLIAEHIGGGWGNDVEDDKYTEPAWVIRGTDIPDARSCDFSKVPFRYHTKSNLKSRHLMPGDIIFEVSGGSKGQPLGRSLYVSSELLAAFNGDLVICASFCKRIQPDSEQYAPELLYLSFLDAYVSGEIEQYQVQSTGISNYKWTDYLENVSRCVPPVALQERFCELSGPLFSGIATLGRKNTTLRRTRDLLLPRLIYGEVDVSELDISVPEEAVT
jgi:type I restriction enzyme S subunit